MILPFNKGMIFPFLSVSFRSNQISHTTKSHQKGIFVVPVWKVFFHTGPNKHTFCGILECLHNVLYKTFLVLYKTNRLIDPSYAQKSIRPSPLKRLILFSKSIRRNSNIEFLCYLNSKQKYLISITKITRYLKSLRKLTQTKSLKKEVYSFLLMLSHNRKVHL